MSWASWINSTLRSSESSWRKGLNRWEGQSWESGGRGWESSPREEGGPSRTNIEAASNLTCSLPSLSYLRCRGEENPVSTLYIMQVSLQMENTIKHSGYWFSNCHVLYDLPLESNVHLLFLPGVLEITKQFLNHLNIYMYFCDFMIPFMPLHNSKASIFSIFSFQTK